MHIVGVVFMLMLYIIVSEKKNNGIHKQHSLRQLFC